jgi:hypothetical protein
MYAFHAYMIAIRHRNMGGDVMRQLTDVNFLLVGEPTDTDELTQKEEKVLRAICKLSLPERRRIHHLLTAMLKNTVEAVGD